MSKPTPKPPPEPRATPEAGPDRGGGTAAAGTPVAPGEPLLEIQDLWKSFPGVQAVRAANLSVHAGEVVALVGENGAGKSSLIKAITGAHAPDRGRVLFGGREVTGAGPVQTAAAGIAVIYQELNQVPQLTVRENLFLGQEPGGRHLLRPALERRLAGEVLNRLGLAVEMEARIGNLDLPRQQITEVARALLADARLLIMDEPTAALNPREVERLFAVLADLRTSGLGILFISHRLEEIFRLADRIVVMRDGEILGAWPTGDLSRNQLIEAMVGRPVDQEFPQRTGKRGAALLAVQDLAGEKVKDLSFSIHRGEVLGLAGLAGAGRTELARLLFGAERPRSGKILWDSLPVEIKTPRDAIARGICLLTEDRKGQGLVLGLSARDNFALPNLTRWSRAGWIDCRREQDAFARYVENLGIRLAGPKQLASELSGGNQQKLLVARWLENAAQCVIFDEPTRGIDVGTKFEIYKLINALADRGKAVLMISSELPEILGMSDRVLVMHEGSLTGEITDMAQATQEALLDLAVR